MVTRNRWILIASAVVLLAVIIFLIVWFTRPDTPAATVTLTPTAESVQEEPGDSDSARLLESDLEHTIMTHEDASIIRDHFDAVVSLEPLTSVSDSSAPPSTAVPIRCIERIVYISGENDHINTTTETVIRQLALAPFAPCERMKALKRLDSRIGRLLSHVSALAKVMESQRNTLIIEHGFDLTSAPYDSWAERTQDLVTRRWDVMAFVGTAKKWQPVQGQAWIRLLEGDCAGCYLVNKSYISTLFSHLVNQLRQTLSDKSTGIGPLEQAIATLQAQDSWISWPDLVDCKTTTPEPPLTLLRVGVCLIAIGVDQNRQLHRSQLDAVQHLLKPHELEFFVVSDVLDVSPSVEGCTVHLLKVSSDTEFERFTLLADLMPQLADRGIDHVFYCDVDFPIFPRFRDPWAAVELLVNGLVAGTPLHSEEYLAQFHGGTLSAYTHMCESLTLADDDDDQAKLNRFLALVPPVTTLFLDPQL